MSGFKTGNTDNLYDPITGAWVGVKNLDGSEGTYAVGALPLTLPSSMFGKLVTDAIVTNGQPTVTSASAGFSAGDVGKLVMVTDSTNSANIFRGVIKSVSGNTATLFSNATVSFSSGNCMFGMDCYSTLTTAMALAVTLKQGTLSLPAGIFMVSQGLIIPDGLRLLGQGRQFTIYNQVMSQGTVIAAGGSGTWSATSSVVQVGVTTAKTGTICARIEEIGVDAGNTAGYAIYHHGVASEVIRCRAHRGANVALFSDAAIGRILECGITQQLRGYGLDIQGATDVLVRDNLINGAAGTSGSPTANVRLSTAISGDIQFIGNHVFQESPIGSTLPANNMWIVANSTVELGVTIGANVFDCCYGHQILCEVNASGVVQYVDITGNWFIQNDANFPHNTFDVLQLKSAAGGAIAFVSFTGNHGGNLVNTNSWATMVNPTGGGTYLGISATGNTFKNVEKIVPTGFSLDGGNANNSAQNQAGATRFSNARGRSTQTGNGATVAFTIAHGLADIPLWWNVTPRVALAAPAFIVTADATFLTVTYATAPPASANNVDLQWSAGL